MKLNYSPVFGSVAWYEDWVMLQCGALAVRRRLGLVK